MSYLPDSAREFHLPGACLKLSESSYGERPDVAERVLTFTGNVPGFRSLSAALLVVANELQGSLDLTTLPWVQGALAKPFHLRIGQAPAASSAGSGSVQELPDRYEWLLSDSEVDSIAVHLHGLGYAWNHLHFDPIPGGSRHAVCCYLDDAV